MAEAVRQDSSEPRGVLGAFNELLTQPLLSLKRARDSSAPPVRVIAGSLLCYALYGAAAGFFQEGGAILMAALKAPLIIAWSVVLCLPSLYVFSAMGGADLSGRRFLALVSGFAGMLALLLAGLLPIAWLFSVSSRSLEFVVWLQVFFWLLALSFAGKYLRRALTEFGARGAVFFWLPLFGIVSFQVATFLRPVLWREPGAPCFDGQKMFFLQHLGRVLD